MAEDDRAGTCVFYVVIYHRTVLGLKAVSANTCCFPLPLLHHRTMRSPTRECDQGTDITCPCWTEFLTQKECP